MNVVSPNGNRALQAGRGERRAWLLILAFLVVFWAVVGFAVYELVVWL